MKHAIKSNFVSIPFVTHKPHETETQLKHTEIIGKLGSFKIGINRKGK